MDTIDGKFVLYAQGLEFDPQYCDKRKKKQELTKTRWMYKELSYINNGVVSAIKNKLSHNL